MKLPLQCIAFAIGWWLLLYALTAFINNQWDASAWENPARPIMVMVWFMATGLSIAIWVDVKTRRK